MKIASSNHISSEIFIHVHWHCLDDKPLLKPDVEKYVHEFIEIYCQKMKGVILKGIGGTETHVHLVFQMEPLVTLSNVVGKIKGSSTHEVNEKFGGDFYWQRGADYVSFRGEELEKVLQYVRTQKEHHGGDD